jgi:hypothetical protein
MESKEKKGCFLTKIWIAAYLYGMKDAEQKLIARGEASNRFFKAIDDKLESFV